MRSANAIGMNSVYEETMATPGTASKLTRYQPSAAKSKGDFNESLGNGHTIVAQDQEDQSFGGSYRKSDIGMHSKRRVVLQDCQIENVDIPYFANEGAAATGKKDLNDL